MWPWVPAAIGAIGSVVGGLVSSRGQSEANETNVDLARMNNQFNAEQAGITRDFNADQADVSRNWSSWEAHHARNFSDAQASRQMEFQREMSNTAYQRATSDLLTAGLNPMLAYQQGGASSPSGASGSASMGSSSAASGPAAHGVPARVENELAAFSNASQGALIAANVEKVMAETENVRADTASKVASTSLTEETTRRVKFEVDKILPERFVSIVNEAIMSGYQEATTRRLYNERDRQKWFVSTVMDDVAHAGLTDASRKALEYRLPGLYNMMKSDQTAYGRNVRPYLHDVSIGAHSALDAARSVYGGIGLRAPRPRSTERTREYAPDGKSYSEYLRYQ